MALHVQDKLFFAQTPETFRGVLGPKVSGFFAMEDIASILPLSSIVLFSSVSSLVAPLGQPNYAAANAILNSVASIHVQKVHIVHEMMSQCMRWY